MHRQLPSLDQQGVVPSRLSLGLLLSLHTLYHVAKNSRLVIRVPTICASALAVKGRCCMTPPIPRWMRPPSARKRPALSSILRHM
jgi:hypothetical protein